MDNLLQLVMIVKNAETVIEKTLKSYIPYISSWCILDTGSSDNTKKMGILYPDLVFINAKHRIKKKERNNPD